MIHMETYPIWLLRFQYKNWDIMKWIYDRILTTINYKATYFAPY